ncbi:hypothetical protein Pmar_PMAR017095 [Perkinsus marinus ATCC 50983]|uniref:Uncharacterized protein n=1 Tax=Perkinsus marinus (strain ATCC 50983 / TXsc) TaxID=423536 RepID=C5LSJ6_PERM5|nr:hypothetical protein Pmar_PMAR017095 [Perkinsus marinus ATCC 50983]EER00237.1 hypothetical protein Pmar_PMAR017095 [Perkinsus marinus ATCC 50983]|eukprot:XP_002767519.1 hypothetical protein Pmar_PMAR017095 [Perkinsus marinus ATCC 50983]
MSVNADTSLGGGSRRQANRYELAALTRVVAAVPKTDSRWGFRSGARDKILRHSGVDFIHAPYSNAELNRLEEAVEDTRASLGWDEDKTWKYIRESAGRNNQEKFWPTLFAKARLPHRSCESMQQTIRRHLVPDKYYRDNRRLTEEEKKLLAEVQRGEVKMSLAELSEMMELPKYVIDDYMGILRRGFNQGVSSRSVEEEEERVGLPPFKERSRWLCAALVKVYGVAFPFHLEPDPIKTPELVKVYKKIAQANYPDTPLVESICNPRQFNNGFRAAIKKANKYAWDKLNNKDAYCQHIVRRLADATEGKLKSLDGSINPFPALILEQVPWRLVAPCWNGEAAKDFFKTVLIEKLTRKSSSDIPFDKLIDELWDAWQLSEEESVEEKQSAEEYERHVRTFIAAVAVSVEKSLRGKVPKSYQLDEVPEVEGWSRAAKTRERKGNKRRVLEEEAAAPNTVVLEPSEGSGGDARATVEVESVEEKSQEGTKHEEPAAGSVSQFSKEERCRLLALALIDQYGVDFEFPHDDDVAALESIRSRFERYLGLRGVYCKVERAEVVSLLKHIIRQGTRAAWDALEHWEAFSRYLIRRVHAAVHGTLRDKRTGKALARPASREEIPWKHIAPCWNPKGIRSVFADSVMPVLNEEDVGSMSLDGVVDSLWEAWELPASDGGEEAEAYIEFEKAVREHFISLAAAADPTVRARISKKTPAEVQEKRQARSSEKGSVRSSENGPVRSSKNGPVRSSENGPVRSSEKGPVRSSENGPVRSSEKGPVRSSEKGPVRSSEKGPVRSSEKAARRMSEKGPEVAATAAPSRKRLSDLLKGAAKHASKRRKVPH